MHAINDTLKKTLKAQEDCAALQAARFELMNKGRKGNKILCSPCVWSNNINSMMTLNRSYAISMNISKNEVTCRSSKSTFYCQAIEPFADLKIVMIDTAFDSLPL